MFIYFSHPFSKIKKILNVKTFYPAILDKKLKLRKKYV
jgi:hypothetical protein